MYSKKTILIVDDEPQNLALANQALRDLYTLVFAKSGTAALEAVEKHKPDLVVLDISMPDMSGFEVCETIKAKPETAEIPVIFLTSKESIADEEHALIVGGDDFIRKPLEFLILRLRIRNQLSLVRLGRLEQSHRDAVQMLSEAGHYNDTDTGLHIWRMAAYAAELAQVYGLPEHEVELIRMAAPMHDTGKIGTPDNILKKPGKLDPEEWEIMKQHSVVGHKILSKSSASLFQAAALIAKHHHEKWDGSGYPDSLKGESIPLYARIVAVADVFDALTTRRPYKEPWSVDASFQYIADNSGSHFDPQLAELFLSRRSEILNLKNRYKDEE